MPWKQIRSGMEGCGLELRSIFLEGWRKGKIMNKFVSGELLYCSRLRHEDRGLIPESS